MKLLLRAPQISPTMGSLIQPGVGRVADSGARWAPAAVPFSRNATCSLHLKPDVTMSFGSVGFMGIGSLKEGNRAGQHGVRYPQASPDGISPENAESGAREEFLEQAKAESASLIDDEQEPFRDAAESGQTIGEATTGLQFGENGGKSADETISNTSRELFEQSKTNGESGEPTKEDPDHEREEVSSEVWGSKDEGGSTHAFLDDSQTVNFHGEDDESVLGIGGQRAGDSQM